MIVIGIETSVGQEANLVPNVIFHGHVAPWSTALLSRIIIRASLAFGINNNN